MKTRLPLIVLLLVGLLVAHAPAQAADTEFPDTIQWRKGQPNVSMQSLEGKMVVVLFFQSWCPKCNAWSHELIGQMNEQYGDDLDVALVALKTDGKSIKDAESYLKKKGADLDKWIVGMDPNGGYMSSFNFGSKLFESVVIKPDGTIAEKVKAGRYYPNGSAKDFVLASPKVKETNGQGVTRLIPANTEYDAKLKPVVRAFEYGDLASGMNALKRVPKDLAEDGENIKQIVMSHLEAKLPTLQATVEDIEAEDRYPAYKELQLIATQLRRTEIGDAASEIVKAQRQDKGLREEQKAEREFQSMMKKAARLSAEQRASQLPAALRKFAETYEGTYYGRKAQAMADGR